MEVTHLLIVYLFIGWCVLLVHTEGTAEGKAEVVGGVTEAPITEDQQKVYDECRNPDYKKYVKCLMRPKRHGHHTSHGDGPPETDPAHCLETCLKKCDHHLDHECEKKCSSCMKRTRHRHQIITEYETECASGNCGPANDGLRTTNITTNIGINNIINPFAGCINGSGINCTGGCCPRGCGQPGFPPCQPGIPPGIPGYPPGTPGYPPGTPGYPPEVPKYPPGYPSYPGYPPYPGYFGYSGYPGTVPSIPIVPQISLVPQITYGIGFGAAGGCAYNQWLCIQQTGVQGVQPDCSGCGNPVLRYRCDVNCYATYANTPTKLPCKSPECVGGST
ncbi:hypothetical protein P5V15_003120 [Pogonomyrmex californicus]